MRARIFSDRSLAVTPLSLVAADCFAWALRSSGERLSQRDRASSEKTWRWICLVIFTGEAYEMPHLGFKNRDQERIRPEGRDPAPFDGTVHGRQRLRPARG